MEVPQVNHSKVFLSHLLNDNNHTLDHIVYGLVMSIILSQNLDPAKAESLVKKYIPSQDHRTSDEEDSFDSSSKVDPQLIATICEFISYIFSDLPVEPDEEELTAIARGAMDSHIKDIKEKIENQPSIDEVMSLGVDNPRLSYFAIHPMKERLLAHLKKTLGLLKFYPKEFGTSVSMTMAKVEALVEACKEYNSSPLTLDLTDAEWEGEAFDYFVSRLSEFPILTLEVDEKYIQPHQKELFAKLSGDNFSSL